MLKPISFTPIAKGVSYLDDLDIAIRQCMFNDYTQALFQELDQLSDSCEELIYLRSHIDEFRTDPSFQEAVGLRLERQGYTTSLEVEGGISKTMGAVVDKILTFFAKVMRYIQEVMMVSCDACAKLVEKLASLEESPDNVAKLKKEYTSNGPSAETLTEFFQYLIDNQKNVIEQVNKLATAQASSQPASGATTQDAEANKQIEAQGVEQNAKKTDSKLDEIVNRLKEQSGIGHGEQSAGAGLSPDEGRWFSSSTLKTLASTVKNMQGYVNMLKDLQSRVRGMANSVKSDSQMDKSLAKTKLDTLKSITKGIDAEIKLVMKFTTTLAKQCQVMIKIITKK